MREMSRSAKGKRIWLVFCWASVMFPTVLSSIAHADGEPAAWVGSSLRPIDSDSIRMVGERVVICLSPTTAAVKANFVFENEGNDCEQVIAFPAYGADNFRAWVSGREVETGRQQRDGLTDEGLFYWTVSFPAGARRTVHVRYETRRDTLLGGALGVQNFTYILTTGRRWKGPIGTAEIVLKLVDVKHSQIAELRPPGYTRTRTGYRWMLHDIEPTQNVRVRFRTTPLKVVVRRAGGNDWAYRGYPPLVRGDTVLISSRLLRSAGYFSAEWNNTTKTFTARRGPLTIRCQVGSREAFLGERRITLRAGPEIRDGQTMIPIDLAQPLGMNALYKPHTGELFLRQNRLNWDATTEPEYAGLHLAPRQYLLSDYDEDQRKLEAKLETSSGEAQAEALFKLADISYYCGEWEKAETQYAQVPQLGPKYLWARWWRAKCVQRQERYDEAARLFSAEVKQPGSAQPMPRRYVSLCALEAVLCITKYQTGRGVPEEVLALAMAAARQGEELTSGPQLQKLRAETLFLFAKANRHEEMLDIADRLLSSGDVADPEFRRLLAPLSNKAILFRGEGKRLGYMVANRFPGTELEEEFLEAVGRAEWSTDSKKAMEVYELLVEKFPDSKYVPRYLARIAEAAKKLEGIDAFKDRCWQLITEYPAAAGQCAYLFARYASEEQLRWMIGNLPDPPTTVHLALADLEYWQGRYESALEHYLHHGIGGDLRGTAQVRVTLMAGLCRLHLGEMDQAREVFNYLIRRLGTESGLYQQILAEGPESEAAYVAISGAWRGSRVVLRRGLTKHPRSAQLHHEMGLTFWREYDRERQKDDDASRQLLLNAVREYHSAVDLDPDFKSYRLALSETYCALGRYEQDPDKKKQYYLQAIAHWKVTAGLKPEDSLLTGPLTPDFLDSARSYLGQ